MGSTNTMFVAFKNQLGITDFTVVLKEDLKSHQILYKSHRP